MNNRPSVFLFICLCSFQIAFCQFTLDGEFRPRTEYRHGFGNIIADGADPGFAISTRTRLNAGYKFSSYEFYLSLQDVMVWGENRQILPYDQNNSFAVFQAWAKLKLAKDLSAKLGRQVIAYDDQRIFGGLDWAQQGRNHDAALVSYGKDRFMVDLGLAFNQDFSNPSGFQSVGTAYNTSGFFSYKTMQYLYLKQQWTDFSGSLLLLNNGFQDFTEEGEDLVADGVSNLQTFGSHLNYSKGKVKATFNAFFQTGERQNRVEVGSAYLLGLDLTYRASPKIGLGIGAEMISGDKSGTADKTEAFFPLYGTNHKFNGFMDYFYVGNHANSIGLFDLHASADLKLGKKSSLLLKVLKFNGEQDLPSGESSLGTEVDVVFSQNLDGFGFKIGYSQLFAADGMYELKGISEGAAADSQNWVWAMLVIKPKFIKASGQ
ncbi:alginate export family protein [Pseudozobellia thermophila]|uniref:Alginate export n=1 Tax=Pseudozobellia thermophila TaxID=192903 RepID=A0A1M6FRQ9_9FLAO|nr:alginate export family protein [Pseudozobellia thermophila]SHJ00309.1 Alginate export [Pseudozobellia thermophila]